MSKYGIPALLPVAVALVLGGCTNIGTYSLAQQCAHQPGCVTAQPQSANGPRHVDAIRPQDAGMWEPVVKVRKPPKQKP